MRLVLRKYYLLLVCTISLFAANNSLQAQNVLDQAGLTSATPAAVAYGTRKLSTSYSGPIMRIRRSSDNAEADLAFDANAVLSLNSNATYVSVGSGTVTLSSFVGSSSAYVSIWYDQSGNGRHATQTVAANQPMIVSGGTLINNANLNGKPTITFNGSNTFLDLPMASTVVNAAGTISAVQVQPILQSGFNAVVAWSSTSGGTQGPGFGPLNALGAFGLYTTWGPQNLNMGPVSIGQKYIMNASWSGNGSSVVEAKNGNQLTGSFGAAFNFTGNAWIGRDNGGYYNGSLAELIVSATTISNDNRTAMEQSQAAFYGVSITRAGALNFDGTKDYVNLGNILGASYTKEAWVNIGNTSSIDNFISGGAISQHAFWAPPTYGNRLSAGHNSIWNQVQDPTPLNVGQWYHVAVTYDAPTTTMKLYKNGELVSTNTAVPAYGGGGNLVLLGSYQAGTNLLNGSLDEVRIWSRVLCQGEIQNNMNGELATGQTGLTAYYKFNQGFVGLSNTAIKTLQDNSGNNNHGQLAGFNLSGTSSNWVAGTVSGTSPVFTNSPSPILGASSTCVGGTINLTNANAGTWSSSNPAIATINASGVVTAVSAGTTVISFTTTCGAVSTMNFTVNALPTVAITNSSPAICAGGSTTLSTQTDMVAYWKFNEGLGNTISDASGNNLTGTFNGSVTWTASNAFPGSIAALSNNGGGYVSVNDHPAFAAMQNKMTIEAWVYQTDNVNNAIVDKGNYNFLFMTNPNGQPGLGFFNATDGWSYSTSSVPVNQWVHLALTWDGNTKTLKFYKNGVLTDTFIRPNGLTFDNGPLNIGRQAPSSCQCNIMNGNIDELRLWSTVKSAAEIAANMNQSIVVSSPANFVWSPSTGLNTTIGNNVIASPSANTTYTVTSTNANGCVATASSTVTLRAPLTATVVANGSTNICPTASVTLNGTGAAGNALQLNGNNLNYAQVTNSKLPLGANKRSLEAWIKTTSAGTQGIATWGTELTGQRFGLLTFSGKLYFTGGGADLSGNLTINDGNWHHVAVTYDGTNIALYVDGNLDVSAAKTLNTVGTIFRIGQRADGTVALNQSFNGQIDEVRVWNTNRTAAEILANKNLSVASNSANLVAYYKMDETAGTVTTFADMVNGNPAPTIIGTASTIQSGANINFSSYLWSNNATTSSVAVSSAGNYSFTGTTADGCSFNSAALAVTLRPTPKPTVAASGPLSFCEGGSVNLSAQYGGNAINFNGTNRVTVANTPTIPVGNSNYTMEAWIKPNSITGVNGLIGWGNWGDTNQVNALRFNGPTTLINYWWANDLYVTIPNVLDGKWHHVAATYNGTTRAIILMVC